MGTVEVLEAQATGKQEAGNVTATRQELLEARLAFGHDQPGQRSGCTYSRLSRGGYTSTRLIAESTITCLSFV